jgi:hypothetical protein
MEWKKSIFSGTVRNVMLAGIMAVSWSSAEAQNTAPYFVNPTPSTTTINAYVGDTVVFQVRGKDTKMQTVTLSSTALPAGATMTPALPTTTFMSNNGSHVNSKFKWVPTLADTGYHTITYTLTDNGSSPLTATRTITIHVMPQPCSLNVQTVVQNTGCYGGNNGSITTIVTGSPGPYTYSWNNNTTSANLTNATAGTYTVTVTNGMGCTGTATATVGQPQMMNITGNTSNTSCGPNNGMVNISVSGGTAPYTYSWSNGATTQNLSGVAAGNYIVTVTDAHNCTMMDTFTVGMSVPSNIQVTGTATNYSCNSTNNGAININVSGGTGPYTYSWNNNATTQNLTGLQPGTYIVTVTDALGCTGTDTFTVGAAMPSNISITGTATNYSCNSTSNGVINITATGGTAPYTYSWNNSATTQNLSGLQPGTYIVTVTDAFGCSAMDTFTVGTPQPFNMSNTVTVSPSTTVTGQQPNTIYIGYGPQTVTLTSSANGGSGFTYNWTTTTSTTSLGTNGTLAVSPTGTTSYIVTTMNAAGCIDIDTVTINVMDVRCGTNNEKVKVCHKAPGKPSNQSNLCIDSMSVAGHLAHGDMLGYCTTGNAHGQQSRVAGTEATLSVYPNPTKGTINLVLPKYTDNAQVVVTDLSGKVIRTIEVGANSGRELQVDLTGNAKGVYLVEVVTKQETYRSKVLLQ